MVSNITFRRLNIEETQRIREIDASQYIGRAWRIVDEVRKLIDINYQDPDFPEGYNTHLNRLRETIMTGGVAIGVFDENDRLIGFSTVNNEIFGEKDKYVLLDQIFITLEHRGNGIGKKLFYLSVDAAKKLGADKIYICAGSSEETVAFYFALGCEFATEINKKLYEADERDLQLEFTL